MKTRDLRVEGYRPLVSPAMLLDDSCGSTIDEGFVLQFFLDGARFGFDSCNFLVKPLLFPCPVGRDNRQKDLS